MPKYFSKLSKFGGQFRLTIPRALVAEMGWEDVEFVIIKEYPPGVMLVRRFIDGESLRTELETDNTKSC